MGMDGAKKSTRGVMRVWGTGTCRRERNRMRMRTDPALQLWHEPSMRELAWIAHHLA